MGPKGRAIAACPVMQVTACKAAENLANNMILVVTMHRHLPRLFALGEQTGAGHRQKKMFERRQHGVVGV